DLAGRFSPSLMAKMQAAPDLTLYARYGYGFKAPNSTQLYLNYGVPGTYLRVGNPNLRPEISRGWELGLDYGTAQRGIQFAVFDNRYRDFIDQDVAITPTRRSGIQHGQGCIRWVSRVMPIDPGCASTALSLAETGSLITTGIAGAAWHGRAGVIKTRANTSIPLHR